MNRLNIPFTPTALSRTTLELRQIVDICKKNKIEVFLNIFIRTPEEVEKIIKICQNNNIEITGSIFQRTPENLEKILFLCKEKNIPLNNTMLFRTKEEIEEILEICDEYKINYIDGMFKRKPIEVREIIDICLEKNIPVKGNVFRKNKDDFLDVVNTCERLNIAPTGTVFKRTGKEIEAIYNISMELLNTPPTNNFFNKKPEEVHDILETCLYYKVPITGTVFRKSAKELEETMEFIKRYYGDKFLLPQIVIYSKKHLQCVLEYLKGKGCLDIVINSPGILKLTLYEIIEREIYISRNNEKLITEDNRFNSVFGWSRKYFEERKKELEKKNNTK